MKKAYKVTLIIFATLFSLWLVVTVYFYNHHTVTVKTINLAGWDLDTSETGVQWKEITFVNKKENHRKLFAEPLFSEKQVALLNSLPAPLQRAAFTTRAFYRERYEKLTDSWNVTVTGIALKDEYDHEVTLKLPRVLIEDEQGNIIGFINNSLQRQDDTNIVYLGRSREDAKFDIENPSKITWYWDEEHPFEAELNNVTHETRRYGFFNQRPQETQRIFSFYGEISNDIFDLSKGEKVKSEWIEDKASDLLEKYKFLPNSPWYVGDHNGYTDVFAMAVGYYADDGYEYQDKVAEQQWFFVEENGQWVLIDQVLLEDI